MSGKTIKSSDYRLAEALRANLKRRKAQARARAARSAHVPRFSGNSANTGPSSAAKMEE